MRFIILGLLVCLCFTQGSQDDQNPTTEIKTLKLKYCVVENENLVKMRNRDLDNALKLCEDYRIYLIQKGQTSEALPDHFQVIASQLEMEHMTLDEYEKAITESTKTIVEMHMEDMLKCRQQLKELGQDSYTYE